MNHTKHQPVKTDLIESISHISKMAPNVDPAILEALQLDPEQTEIASHGGSGFASSFKLTSVIDGQPTNFFVKTGSGKDAEVMFRGQ